MRISSIGYCVRQGFKNIWKNKMFSLASIATMSACIFLFGIFMIKEGLVLCEIGAWNPLPGLGLSSAWQYAAVPCSGFAMCVYSLQQFINDIKGKGKD